MGGSHRHLIPNSVVGAGAVLAVEGGREGKGGCDGKVAEGEVVDRLLSEMREGRVR